MRPSAFREENDIAAHDLATGDAPAFAVSDDERARAGQIAQPLQNLFGAFFLDDRNRDDDGDEGEQHQRFAEIAEDQVDQAGADQQLKHRLAPDLERDAQQRALLRLRQFVGTFPAQAGRRLLFGEAGHRPARSFSHDRLPSAEAARRAFRRARPPGTAY
jgi:hypothetical protein